MISFTASTPVGRHVGEPATHEEVFGPSAPIIRFTNDEQATRIADATEYGLSSAVFTPDLAREMQFAKHIDAGMTHIND